MHDDLALKFLKPLVANALHDVNREWVADAVLNSLRRWF